MLQSAPSTYNRQAFYTVHGVAVVLDLVVIGTCAWVASDAVQGQIDTPHGGRYRPILMVVAASIAALWSSIVVGLAGMDVVTLPFGSWYNLTCTVLVVPLYIIAVVILATRITPVGTCRFDGGIYFDHSNESCAEFWYKLQRVQIVAVVLAGIVLITLFVEAVYTIHMRVKARNSKRSRISIA